MLRKFKRGDEITPNYDARRVRSMFGKVSIFSHYTPIVCPCGGRTLMIDGSPELFCESTFDVLPSTARVLQDLAQGNICQAKQRFRDN